MTVKANKNDIYEYVIGLSPYDALERSMDQADRARYEFYDEFIYDFQESKKYRQNAAYVKYMDEVTKLKRIFKEEGMSHAETMKVADSIASIAPKEVNLSTTD